LEKPAPLDKDLYSFWSRQLFDLLLPCWLFTDSLSPSADKEPIPFARQIVPSAYDEPKYVRQVRPQEANIR
jgi:hypothetical protein